MRNVPDDTHAELASRAALNGQSLQEYLRGHLTALAARPDMKALMSRVESGFTARAPTPPPSILEHLDAIRGS